MALPTYTLYKRCKIDGAWRYCRAAMYSNGKIKPNVVIVKDRELEIVEGAYYVNDKNKWIHVGTDALKAQQQRGVMLDRFEALRLSGRQIVSPEAPKGGKTPLLQAVETYFTNLESQGKDSKTIRAYRSAVDPFAAQCGKLYVEDVEKQDVVDYMGWLRKQPIPMRVHGNPNRTMANKVGYVAIFLKAFGVEKLLKKSEYPKYHEKKIVAHTDEELALLYSHANEEETFLLDFFLGSMARDHEAYGCRYRDLTGTTLTLFGKQNKTRTVEISPRLAQSINERRKRSKHEYLFVNRNGKPNQHLLRDIQDLAEKAGAKFHTELHKLRKTGASRRYRAGCLLNSLMLELGHESLSTTQIYLSDVKLDDTKKAVAKADFVPTPQIVKTGTGGD
jgi:integrase